MLVWTVSSDSETRGDFIILKQELGRSSLVACGAEFSYVWVGHFVSDQAQVRAPLSRISRLPLSAIVVAESGNLEIPNGSALTTV